MAAAPDCRTTFYGNQPFHPMQHALQSGSNAPNFMHYQPFVNPADFRNPDFRTHDFRTAANFQQFQLHQFALPSVPQVVQQNAGETQRGAAAFAQSCRYSSWCSDKKDADKFLTNIVEDDSCWDYEEPTAMIMPSAQDDPMNLANPFNWKDLEESCRKMDRANMVITEVDLTCVDENSGNVMYEFVFENVDKSNHGPGGSQHGPDRSQSPLIRERHIGGTSDRSSSSSASGELKPVDSTSDLPSSCSESSHHGSGNLSYLRNRLEVVRGERATSAGSGSLMGSPVVKVQAAAAIPPRHPAFAPVASEPVASGAWSPVVVPQAPALTKPPGALTKPQPASTAKSQVKRQTSFSRMMQGLKTKFSGAFKKAEAGGTDHPLRSFQSESALGTESPAPRPGRAQSWFGKRIRNSSMSNPQLQQKPITTPAPVDPTPTLARCNSFS